MVMWGKMLFLHASMQIQCLNVRKMRGGRATVKIIYYIEFISTHHVLWYPDTENIFHDSRSASSLLGILVIINQNVFC